MFDPSRRDSMSRRVQSKAEKRAEHNAIERQRREGLNTRFQQLSHLLPNLHNDTRPSKGTIIERTLEFVRDAIKNEERYKAEIKDLRMTNRQLLKQLTHLTTGQCDEEDEEDVAAIDSSNAAIVHGSTRPMDVVSSSSPSPSGSVVATTPSPPPSSHQLPPQAVFKSPTSSMSSIQQHETSPSSRAPSLSPTTTAVPQMSLSTTSNPPLSPTMMPPMPSAAATSIPLAYSPMAPQQQQPCMIAPPPNTLGSSLSSFASDVWHDPTSHGPTWQDQQHPRRVSMSVQPTVYQVHPHGKMIVPKLDDMSRKSKKRHYQRVPMGEKKVTIEPKQEILEGSVRSCTSNCASFARIGEKES
ncbi:hypothetical protein BC940DRAFT_148397 [Gongronella butleri]|nr:hypothetical protein BC940DRAFT_148397 [Gongronella butleri]